MKKNYDDVHGLKIKQCSTCNAIFECSSSPDCWCMNVSKLTRKEIDNKDCLCKNCLLKKYQQKLFRK